MSDRIERTDLAQQHYDSVVQRPAFTPISEVDDELTYWYSSCSCGWVCPYTHAYQKYAMEDWRFHSETAHNTQHNTQEENNRE